jgi:hypothetical protein
MLPPASGPEMSATTYKQTRRHIPEDTDITSTARTISNLTMFPLSIVKRKSGYEQSEDLEVILKVSARKAHIPRVKKSWDADKRWQTGLDMETVVVEGLEGIR